MASPFASPAFGLVAFVVLLSHIFVFKILCNISPGAIFIFLETDVSDATPCVFESIVCAFLFTIWLRDRALGSQIIKYFACGTSLFLSPVWVPRSFDHFHTLLRVISGARPHPIHVEAIAIWGSLFERACQRVTPDVAQAWCRLNPPLNPPMALFVLPALAVFALKVSIFYVLRFSAPRLLTLRGLGTPAVRCIETALFLVVNAVFWRLPCAVYRLFHQSDITNLVLRALVLAIFMAMELEKATNRIKASASAVFKMTFVLAHHYREPGSVYVDPQLETMGFYGLVFVGCFMGSGYVHIMCFDYPLRYVIPIAAGWGLAGLTLLPILNLSRSYVPVPWFRSLRSLLRPTLPFLPRVLAPRPEIPPAAAHPPSALAPAQSPNTSTVAIPQPSISESLPPAASESSGPSRPPSPTPSSSSSFSDESNTDWSLVTRHPDWSLPRHFLARRSLAEFPSTPHRALSPILEVSSVASTMSVASTECSSPTSDASPDPSPSRMLLPPASPPHTTPRQVSKARAQRDMAEFRSFSLALENRTPVRIRASGGDGGDLQSNDALQSNGAVAKDVDVFSGGGVAWRRHPVESALESEYKEAGHGQSKVKFLSPCRPNCESFYCAGECVDGSSAVFA
ncbi:hypothetical protein MVEN_00220400 [Mycena venus]|uniref:Uncharacterized protein n=1 Tax=Mycena venus TaxID=2733690 RepID=A0A8H6Z164_9AGAR|nr:hypothetical protein MVEN_00220400 [Mycena venus]